jgi:hypothetical protein
MEVSSHITIRTHKVADLFERAKLYRHEALSVHKLGSSIAEDSLIICREVLSTHKTEAILHGYFCHMILLYMRARCLWLMTG